MTNEITFTDIDAMLLFCMPTGGGSPEDMLHSYHFMDRAALPNFEDFNNTLRKLTKCGFIAWSNNSIKILDAWNDKIEALNKQEGDFYEAANLFVDLLIGKTWPIVSQVQESVNFISAADYEIVVDKIHEPFKKNKKK